MDGRFEANQTCNESHKRQTRVRVQWRAWSHLRHARDEIVRVRRPGRALDFSVRRAPLAPQRDIVAQRDAEERRLLLHEAD